MRVLTAGGVTCVNRWASRQQSHRLYRSAGVLQWSEHRIEVVLVAAVMEIAGIVTAQVVAIRSNAVKVSWIVIRNNTGLEDHSVRSPVNAAANGCETPSESPIA